VPLSAVSPLLREATIAAEDASFYDNPGFDPRAVVRAVYQLVRTGAPQSGASTITQQLVKNTLLGPEQTAERKIKEAFLAMELTRRYSKDQILEMYLNEINYGNQAYGVEAAAETYFGKSARDLTLPEAALLAGLPQAPSYYDPLTNLAAAKQRQAYVLEQMERTGVITPAEREQASRAPLAFRPPTAGTANEAPHFVNYVRQLVEDQYGTEALYRGGLQVTTSLDLDAQHAAELAAREHIDAIRARNATNAALVSIRPSTGEIVAMVGSVDFYDSSIDGQVNVALAERQPGSTLKPFTYLTAFGKGWNPATPLMDAPTTFGGTYTPLDFDGKFLGPMSVRDALAQSRNIPAVEALEFVGVPDMLATAHRLGIEGLRDPSRYGLSVTLGGGEVRLLDLTYAYAGFANGGRQMGEARPPERREPGFRERDPVAILKVTDAGGKVLYQYDPPPAVEVADPRLVYQVTSILSDDRARAPTYGRNSVLVLGDRPAAVKTGTTDEYRDSWVVGYTPDLVTGVWVGNNDNSPMKDVLGVAGAGQIWHDYMQAALAGTPPTPFARPQGVVQAEVCALSGLLPTPQCRENALPIHGTVTDYFVPGVNLPTKDDTMHESVELCKVNGKRATPLVPQNARQTVVFAVFPTQYRAWAGAHGYPAPPSQDCSDVYTGERRVSVVAPRPTDQVIAGARVQVVGSAYVDDFHHYTLEVGAGDNPTTWATLTDRRQQAVDNGLLGVWDTSAAQPGLYTLRLQVSDSFDNVQEGRFQVTISPAPTPTVTPTQRPTSPPTPPTVAATPTRAPAAPAGAPPPSATPRPAAPTTPTPAPTRRPG
jgi:1A family penicillin-binding protein